MANLIKLYINKYYITYNLRKYMGCTPAAGKGFNKS